MRKHDSDKVATEMTFSAESAPFYESTYETNWDFKEPLQALQTSDELSVPISIFGVKAPTLQVLAFYLRDAAGLSFREIAEATGRAESTLRVTYRNAPKDALNILPGYEIPVSLFKELGLSPLETLVYFLTEKGLRNSEIAAILCLDPRTTSTVSRRVREKQAKQNDEVMPHA